jgi:hypothetical protein
MVGAHDVMVYVTVVLTVLVVIIGLLDEVVAGDDVDDAPLKADVDEGAEPEVVVTAPLPLVADVIGDAEAVDDETLDDPEVGEAELELDVPGS